MNKHKRYRDNLRKDPEKWAAFKEKSQARHAAWRKTPVGKSKVNASSRARRESGMQALYSKSHHEAERLSKPFRMLISSAKSRAGKKKIPFDLDVQWALSVWTGKCALSGLEFRTNLGGSHAGIFSPSIDRIKPRLGYVKDNCRFILLGLNNFKHVGTDEDMYEIAEALIKARYRPQP